VCWGSTSSLTLGALTSLANTLMTTYLEVASSISVPNTSTSLPSKDHFISNKQRAQPTFFAFLWFNVFLDRWFFRITIKRCYKDLALKSLSLEQSINWVFPNISGYMGA
jgi:hypothetical protein